MLYKLHYTHTIHYINARITHSGIKIFQGIKRAIMFIIIFFIPEWCPLIESFIKEPAKYFREIFWDSMNIREKMGYKRGDLIDCMLTLKNGKQNPIYSKDHFSRKII